MCGIAGHVQFDGSPNRAGVEALVNGIRHRGPDGSGIETSPDGISVLGHTRLSIIDLSDAGRQPMIDAVTGNQITFNGEIYNYVELRRECENDGYQFQSDTDTEVILALYRKEGTDCLRRLRGMFAFALWDSGRKRLFLARDRVGKKPLNYALEKGGLVFCSELHPLALFPGVRRDEDGEALELYLQLQYIPAPWTIYEGIRKLPPASYAILDKNGLDIRSYWSVDYRPKLDLNEDEATEALEEKLKEALKIRLRADVPVGALLSGGIDSSLMVALASEIRNAPIKTFNVGFEESRFDESPYAEEVARTCGTEHSSETVRADIHAILPKSVRHYGEPYADQSALPSFAVCESARRHVKVVINGDGGDELLGGYRRYELSPLHQFFGRISLGDSIPRMFIDLDRHFRVGGSLAKKVGRKAVEAVMGTFRTPEMGMALMSRGFWNDAERARLLGSKGRSGALLSWQRMWSSESRKWARGVVDRMLWIDSRTYLPDDLLVKMDIASMHCGLEARSPMLDHEIIEFCATLPFSLKVRDRSGKYLLKKLCERRFGRDFVKRKKMGFTPPTAEWLSGPLKERLHDTLRDPKAMGPFDQTIVRQTLEAFLAGKGNHASRLWCLLTYGLWREQRGSAA